MIPVLYVDDEPDLLAMGKLFLESTGEFTVYTKTSAREGLEALKELTVEAVISDFQMPGMDGLTFLKTIRSGGNNIPFIIFTGRSREEVVIEALNAGADFYLQKGGDPRPQFAELSAKIHQAVGRRNAEAGLRKAVRDWETTFAATSDGICLLDTRCKIIQCNNTMIEIAGEKTGLGLSGQNCWEVLHGTSSHITECPVVPMMKSLRRERSEIRLKDRWFDVIADPVLDTSGKLTGIVHTMRDITERKHAESELRATYEQLAAQEEELRGQYDEIAVLHRKTEQSHIMLQQVLDTVPVRVFWKDADLRLAGCNTPFAIDAGYSGPSDLIGKTDFDMGWRDQAEDYRADDRAVMSSGIPKIGYEEPQTTPDGRKIWLRTSKIPLRDNEGKVTGVLGTYEDITDRKNADSELRVAYEQLTAHEEELRKQYNEIAELQRNTRQSQAMLQQVLDTVPVRVFWKDRDLRYAGSNNPFAIDAGFALPADLIGKTDYDMGWHDQADAYRADDRAVMETGVPKIGFEEPQTTPDGRKIWLRTSKIPLSDSGGVVSGILGTYEDITERKYAESELHAAYEQLTAQDEELRGQYDEIVLREQQVRESEEKFRGVFNNANDEIYIHGTEPDGSPGKFLEVNSTMCAMLGYSREELLQMTVMDIVTEEHRNRMTQIKISFEKTPNFTFPAEHRRKDGSVFPVEVSLHKSSLSGNRIVIAVARDITERKRTEQAIELANKKLNLMNNITRHNLLNIVTGLLGSLDMAIVTEEKSRRDEILSQIRELAGQVQAQMEFSIRYEEVGVREPVWLAVDTIIDRASRAFDRSGVRITTDLKGFEIYADPLFEKVIYNLLDNAVRHGGKVTRIRFLGKIVENGLVLICEDDGVGIPAGMKGTIFEKREGRYYGFELFLVREILTITDITIRETGEPGEGARFEMTVPKNRYRIGRVT